MSNHITVEGRLGKDAEQKYSQAGKPYCAFSLACSTGYGDNKKTTWFNCTLWGKRAESLSPYLVKGQQIVALGEMYEDSFQNRDGVTLKSLKMNVEQVWLVGKKPENSPSGKGAGKLPDNGGSVSFDDDDIPF